MELAERICRPILRCVFDGLQATVSGEQWSNYSIWSTKCE